MIRKLSTNFYALAAAVFLLSLFLSFATSAKEVSGQAPDFTLPSKDEGNVRLQEQIGNVVLVNFWASWCGPCREELPHMEEMQQDFEELGFTILAINVDENPSKANVLLKDIPVSFPVLFDQDDRVSKLYQVKAMPTTVIIDRDGNQRLLHYGYKSGDEKKYRSVVKALLRE